MFLKIIVPSASKGKGDLTYMYECKKAFYAHGYDYPADEVIKCIGYDDKNYVTLILDSKQHIRISGRCTIYFLSDSGKTIDRLTL